MAVFPNTSNKIYNKNEVSFTENDGTYYTRLKSGVYKYNVYWFVGTEESVVGDKVFGTKGNKKGKDVYVCISNHKSKDKNRPISGDKWRNYWAKIEKDSGDEVRKWKEEEDYTATSKKSIKGRFPWGGYTKAEIVSNVIATIDEFNDLAIGGVSFEYDTEIDVSQTGIEFTGDIKDTIYTYNKIYNTTGSFRGSIIFKAYTGGYALYPNKPGNIFHLDIGLRLPNRKKDTASLGLNAINHEMCHAFGLVHQYLNLGEKHKDNNYIYNNRNIVSTFLSKGLIHKAYKSGAKQLYTGEDTVCALDTSHLTISPTALKIKGQINETTNNPDYSLGKTITVNNKTTNFKYGGGYCEAILFDSYAQEMLYRMPIDKTGYFEFRIRVYPLRSSIYKLVVFSHHFSYYCIEQVIQSDGTWDIYERKSNESNFGDGGYIYYEIKDIGSADISGGVVDVGTLDIHKRAFSWADFKRDTGLYVEYNTSGVPLEDEEQVNIKAGEGVLINVSECKVGF